MSATDDMLAAAITERREAGLQLIGQASVLAMEHFRHAASLDVGYKGPRDAVTRADLEVEELIRQDLGRHFPRDGFLGEETGLREAASADAGIWVVDPIDGTQSFVTEMTSWAVSIAYVAGDAIQLGLVACPGRDELFVATRGRRATLNDGPIAVRPATRLDDGLVAVGQSPRTDPAELRSLLGSLVQAGGIYHHDGSGALGLCYVAAGRLIGYVEPIMQPWDCLAGLAIVEAAGGSTNDYLEPGTSLAAGPVVASAPGVYSLLLGFSLDARAGR